MLFQLARDFLFSILLALRTLLPLKLPRRIRPATIGVGTLIVVVGWLALAAVQYLGIRPIAEFNAWGYSR